MLSAITALLMCQLAGEAIVRVASLPIPGPVFGMILLFGALLARAPLPAALDDTAEGLLKHLSLLFVPAGVGVVQHLDRLGSQGLRLFAVVVLATAVALAVTALVFVGVARLLRADQIDPANDREGAATPGGGPAP